jgi:hypothetical protein
VEDLLAHVAGRRPASLTRGGSICPSAGARDVARPSHCAASWPSAVSSAASES